ncbi:MAG: hypothetical protein LBT35_01305 [Tannerella sp.]|jgi:hypothetical protein|nr:hypothetical protein [Tannerella sp.]
MNKILVFLGAALLMACDPVENRDELKGSITADQLNVTATPLVVNGVRSNKIILENHSPVLSSWNYGTGTTSKAYDEVLVTATGDLTIQFTGKNGDGSTITKDIIVNVESIVFEVTGMDLFIGDGSKTWVFDAFTDNNHPYGIGGAVNDKSATWWGPEYGEFDEWDAKLTFSLDGGAIITKTLADGTQQKGTFSFNLSKKVSGWSEGILTLKGATIPHAVSINNAAGDAYEFYIITLAEDQLVLANVSGNGVPDSPDGEANFWMFRPEGFTLADNSEQMAFLSGGSAKTWGWGSGVVFGNGGDTGSGPAWWTMDAAGVNDQKPGEGAGASMAFTSDGKLTLTLADGSTVEGTYKVNMGKKIDGWSIGTLTTQDVYLLAGYSPNEPDKSRVYEYHILSMDDKQMTVAHRWEGEPGVAWYWLFTAQ